MSYTIRNNNNKKLYQYQSCKLPHDPCGDSQCLRYPAESSSSRLSCVLLCATVETEDCLHRPLCFRLPAVFPGMLLMGVALRNIPHVTDWVFIDTKWSASLRNIALAIILARAGLGLDPTVRHRRSV